MYYHPFVFNLYDSLTRKTINIDNTINSNINNNSNTLLISIKESNYFNRNELFIGDVFINKNKKDSLYILKTDLKYNALIHIGFLELFYNENYYNSVENQLLENFIFYKKMIFENELIYIGNIYKDNFTDSNYTQNYLESIYFEYSDEDLISATFLELIEDYFNKLDKYSFYEFDILIKDNKNNLIKKEFKEINKEEDYIQLNNDYCQILLGYYSKRLCSSSEYFPYKRINQKYTAYDFIFLPSGSIFINNENKELKTIYIEIKLKHSHINFSFDDLIDTIFLIPIMDHKGDIIFYNDKKNKVEPIIHPESIFYKNYLYDLENEDFINLLLKII